MIGVIIASVLAWPRPVPLRLEPTEKRGELAVYAGAGDVDGDGTEDLIVGAPGESNGGWVGLWAGGPLPRVVWDRDGATGEALGTIVAGLGDVDGDGLGDFAIGTAGDPAGRIDVYLRVPERDDPAPDEVYLGQSIAGIGDVNGDAHADVAIASGEGHVTVHLGARGGLEAREHVRVIGRDIGWAGDMDGDGRAEVVVGDDDGVRVHRSGDAVPTRFDSFLPGAFAGVGDMDGDGRTDLAIARDGVVQLVSWREGAADPEEHSLGVAGERVAAAGDMNGDGYADLVVMRGDSAVLVIGGTTAREVADVPIGDARGVGDLDGDGFGDVAFGGEDGFISLIRGAGTALGTEPIKLVTPHDDLPFSVVDMVALDGIDLDADGAAEVVVGMRMADDGTGRVDVFSGSDLRQKRQWSGEARGEGFGASVANGGDVDGDGFSDLWIAAPFASNGKLDNSGYIRLLHGGLGIPSFGRRIYGGTDQRLGTHLGGSGDLDGDGRAELAIGNNLTIHFGGAEQRPLLVLELLDVPPAARNPVIGDVDGDGRDEVVTDGPDRIGRVVAWLVDGTLEHVVVPPASYDGIEANAGDVDGDGDVEMLDTNTHIPCPLEQTQDRTAGLVEGAPDFRFEPKIVFGRGGICLGSSVDGAGDVDGDGRADVILGAAAGAGAVFLHLGTAEGIAPTPAWTVVGDRDIRNLGIAVAGAGDVDGDGFADVVIAGRRINGDPDDALVHVYFGNGALGTRSAWRYGVTARQHTGAPLAVGGRSLLPDQFAVWATAASPFGRRVRLEVEAKRHGVAFDGRGLSASGWGDAGSVLMTPVVGLVADTGYAWRARLRTAPSEAAPQARSHWIYGGRPGEARAVHVRTRTNTAPTVVPVVRKIDPDRFVLIAPGVLKDAEDAEGDVLTARIERDAVHGKADIEPNGELTYTPDPGFAGVERFTFIARDGHGGETEGEVMLTVRRRDCGFMSDVSCALGEVFLVVNLPDGAYGSIHCTISAAGVPSCDPDGDEKLVIGAPECGFESGVP